MRSRRRRLLFRTAGTLAAAAFLFALYLRVGILPGTLRESALRKIEAWTHKKVVFERAVFIPFHGLSLTQVGVFEPDGRAVFRARRVTVNARLLPFLREKKIMINRLLLDGAQGDWVMERAAPEAAPAPKTAISGQIEVPVIPENKPPALKDLQYGPDIFLPENVYIERIEIADGAVRVRRTADAEPAETIRSIDVRLTMPSPPVLRFEGRVELGETPYASIELTGVWDLKHDRYEFFLRTKSREMPGWLIDYQQGRFLILRDAEFSLETKVFNGDDNALLFNAKADLKNAVFKLQEARYSGRVRLQADGSFDGRSKRFTRYRGTLELLDVDVKNFSSKIDELDGLAGKLRFEPDLLAVQSLRGRYKTLAFDASGTLRSFKELLVEGDVRSSLSMEQVRALLPSEHREKLKGFEIAGDCEAHTLLSGSLRKGSKMATEYELVLRDGALKNEAKKLAWTGLSGRLRMDDEGVRVEQARFTASGKPHELSVFIPKDAKAPGSFRFHSPEADVSADYTLDGSDLVLKNGRAAFGFGSADFTGRCLHWTDPWLDLEGRAQLNLEKVPASGLDLKGILSGPFTLSGAWDRPTDWDLKIDAQGTPVYWKKRWRLEDFELQVRMRNRRLDVPYAHAKAYGGALGGRMRVDLTGPSPYFDTEFYLNGLDLGRVGPELARPRTDLKGAFIGRLSLEGLFGNVSTYRGKGALSVTNGLLWQTDRFRDMGHLPLVRVEGLDWVTFEQLSATFEVSGKKLHTSDLTLLGDSVDLSLDGTVGFDGALDLVMNIQFSDEVMQGAALTGGFVPLVVHQAGNFISEYRVGGTLDEPTYEKMLLPSLKARA